MSAVLPAPREMVEAIADLRLPPNTDRHLSSLMDRNTNGTLTPDQKDELAALAELSEKMSLIRAEALLLLGRHPQ